MANVEGTPQNERRRFERVELTSDVQMLAVRNLVEGASADVSAGGIYVLTPEELPDGSLVDVEFPLSESGETFRAVGEIRWRQRQPVGDDLRWGLGIEFLHASTADRAALLDFLTDRAAQEDDESGEDNTTTAESVPGIDRRRSRRIPVSTRVRLKSVANLTEAAAADLSAGGIRVLARRDFGVGELVDLEFPIEGLDRIFRLLGEVRWRESLPSDDSSHHVHGIEFVDVDLADVASLQAAVEYRRAAVSR